MKCFLIIGFSVPKGIRTEKYDEMQQDWNPLGLYEMGKQMEELKLKLLESRKKCECTDAEMDDVIQLKDKGLFILKNFERKYENVNEELKDLHDNYVKCVSKVNSREEIDYQEIHFLTLQRDSLKKELIELKMIADENSKKLAEIWKIITAQEVRVPFIFYIILIYLITFFRTFVCRKRTPL